MPIKKCNGGYKYGEEGKCYKGKGARKRAKKQGRAIEVSKLKKKGNT